MRESRVALRAKAVFVHADHKGVGMQADDLATPVSDEVFHNGALWSDGWYLYQGEAVRGPFTVQELFPGAGGGLPAAEQSQAAWLSRKGLSRWYPLSTVHQAFLSSEPAPRVARPRIHPPLLIAKHLGVTNTEASLPLAQQDAAKNFDYYYLISRGRLRLGNKENPWVQGFLKPVFSLGLSWKAWYEQALIEVTYHLDDPQASERLRGFWGILVPGWHLLLLYRLAKLILQMEVQNRYRNTSPLLSLVLGLAPPLAVVYLQKALNRHWDLHVKQTLRGSSTLGNG